MKPGKQRLHRITIQALVPVQDATTGIITDTWPLFAVVYADFRPSSVREFVAANASQSKVMGAFEIDYLAGVKPSMRILHGSSVYNIEGILDDPQTGIEWLTLPVSEVVHG